MTKDVCKNCINTYRDVKMGCGDGKLAWTKHDEMRWTARLVFCPYRKHGDWIKGFEEAYAICQFQMEHIVLNQHE